MKLTVVLAVLIGILVLACSSAAPAPAEPSPNIDATVEAMVKQEVAAQPTATPVVIVKEVTPTDTPEPTSTLVFTAPPNPTSSPSSTLPPISMAIEEMSPEVLACVRTAMGDEQYNAILSGSQSVNPQQFYIVMPCTLQYPQETKAIMDMFGLDMGTIMEASSPTPTPTPVPTATPTTVVSASKLLWLAKHQASQVNLG